MGEPGSRDAALRALLVALKQRGYRFVTPSPRTHAIVLARARRADADPLRDLLGWSLPVAPSQIAADLFALLDDGEALLRDNAGRIRSRYRVSSEGDALYLHSAYPTAETDSVFFGPDSYRFAAFLRRRLDSSAGVQRLVEIGAGSGVGALTAAGRYPGADIVFTDINPAALRLAHINAEAAGVSAAGVLTSGLAETPGSFDLVVANPPYLVDADRRAYRHGGELYGAQIALDWAREALARLNPGGRLLLYSGAPVVGGEDLFLSGLRAIANAGGATLDYEEIDPDVWSEELARPEYENVERIAVGAAVLTQR
jgi:methylase of polypeptide subunit release factors